VHFESPHFDPVKERAKRRRYAVEALRAMRPFSCFRGLLFLQALLRYMLNSDPYRIGDGVTTFLNNVLTLIVIGPIAVAFAQVFRTEWNRSPT
jgi:hypothetical protein